MKKFEYHSYTVGRILAFLINNGLARVDLDASDAMDIMTYREGHEEEVVALFADCLHWMHDEGLIRVANIHEYDGGYDFMGIQLTSTGVAVSKAKTDDPEIGTSIEERVTKEKDGALDTSMYTKIGDFVGSFLGGFTKSMGSG